MTQEQLMKVKIKYLEDRITTMEKSIGSINWTPLNRGRVEYGSRASYTIIQKNS